MRLRWRKREVLLFDSQYCQVLSRPREHGFAISHDNWPLQEFRMRCDELQQLLIVQVLSRHELFVGRLICPQDLLRPQ